LNKIGCAPHSATECSLKLEKQTTKNKSLSKMKNKTFYPWLVVALLWVVALLNYMDRQMLSTMQDAMKLDIVELQKAEAFGALMAVFLWIYGIVSPFAGVVADRVSRKKLVVGSLFVWSAVTYLMGYASDFTQLYWLRALMGVSEALYIPSALSLIADWHEGKSRSLAIGIHMTGLYVGQAVGGFGATIAATFSWHSTFYWFGITGIAYSVVLALLLHDKPKAAAAVAASPNPATLMKKESLWRGLSVVLSTWAFWVILIYFAVPSLPGWATKNWLPTLFADSLGLDMAQAGPMSTITIAASSFVGVLLGGVMSDKWVLRNIRGRIYTSAIGLGMTIPALVLLGFGHSVVAVVGAGMLFGIGFGMFDANNMPILCQIISAKYRATAYGIMNMVGVFAGAAVTQLLGKWTDGGNLGMGFAVLGGIVIVALVLQLVCLRPTSDNVE
jgi:ACS family D-galactonate transporter-like MFS transporter